MNTTTKYRLYKTLISSVATYASESWIRTNSERGRPKKRWIDHVEGDLRELGIRNWKVDAEDRQRCCRVIQNPLGLKVAVK